MKRCFLHSKLHKATITSTNIDYEGSCLIDISILNAAKILPFEKIDIYNVTNGERLSTYAIPGPADSREICANGACCHKINPKDEVIICSYVDLSVEEYENHKPTVLHLNDKKQIQEWLNIYRTMQVKFHIGFVLGILAVMIFCSSFN